MESSNWDKLARIYEQAAALPPGERAAFMDQACAGDPDMRRDVEDLLDHEDKGNRFFEHLGQAVFLPSGEEPSGSAGHDLSGTTVSHYEVRRRLGGGGMGVVYEAYDTRLERTVALKFLPPHLDASAEARLRFIQEAKAASALDHPNICTIYEVGQTDAGQTFIAMACYQGETLKHKIARGPLPVEEALLYAVQIARGLARAHAKGIVHRDVKPANVMVTAPTPGESSYGTVKILDFGLAKMADVELTRTGTTMGTVVYMSPEQTRGAGVDHRTDLWSLGAVLYEMLTGERPFRGDFEQAIVYSILNEDPPPLRQHHPEVPEALEHVVAMCLEKEPDLRYPAAADLLADLEMLVSGRDESLSASRPVPTRILARPNRRLLTGAGGGLLLVLLVLLVIPASRRALLGGSAPVTPAGLTYVAVLPFTSAVPADQALADGLMQSLTGLVARLETPEDSLWVVPADEILNREIQTPTEARKIFGVDAVLRGQMIRRGALTEVILNLEATERPRVLGSATLPGPLDPAFQQKALQALADLLNVRVQDRARAGLDAGSPQTPTAYAFYLQGVGYLQRRDKAGNLDLALEQFRQALAEDSLYAPALAGLCEAVWEKYRNTSDTELAEEALGYCDRAAALSEDHAGVLVALGSMYLRTGQHRKAEAALLRARVLEPSNVDAFLWLARVYGDLGQTDNAEDAYLRAIALKPNLWVSYSNYGAMLYNIGRYEDAGRQFEQVTRLTPDNYIGFNDLGIVQDHFNQIDDAVASFERSINLQPNALAYRNLGDLYFRHQQYDRAVGALEAAVALNDGDWIAWAWLGHARYWAGNRAGAQAAWQRVIELGTPKLAVNPKDDDVLTLLAEAHTARGEKEQGFAYLQRLLSLPRDYPLTKYYIGRLYEMHGYRETALDYIEQVLEEGFDPGTPDRDPWLKALRETPRFQALRSKYLEDHDDAAP